MVVSSSQTGAAKIASWLEDSFDCILAQGEKQANEMMSACPIDLLVVNAPLAQGDAERLCVRAGAGALLLVPQDAFAQTLARMGPQGVLVLGKPVSSILFSQAIGLLWTTHAKVSHMRQKLTEVRVVERAKWILMQTLHMSEDQAHHYIEKQAMDLRRPKRDVAESILKTYEH